MEYYFCAVKHKWKCFYCRSFRRSVYEYVLMVRCSMATSVCTRDYLVAAVSAVHRACRAVSKIQSTWHEDDRWRKEDQSPVTVGDLCAQALILGYLREAFPFVPCLAEEDTKELRHNDLLLQRVTSFAQKFGKQTTTSDNVLAAIDWGQSAVSSSQKEWWCLDPIDGTKGFISDRQYAVALALVRGGCPILGVLGCPVLPPRVTFSHHPHLPGEIVNASSDSGSILFACEGEGAKQFQFSAVDDKHSMEHYVENAMTVTVSDHDVSSRDKIRVCESFEVSHSDHDMVAKVCDASEIRWQSLWMHSQCKYAMVARGDAEAYIRFPREGYRENVWDHAAGAVIVTEAGGKITDLNGKQLDFSKGAKLAGNEGIVVANSSGTLHERILNATQKVRLECLASK